MHGNFQLKEAKHEEGKSGTLQCDGQTDTNSKETKSRSPPASQ